MDVNDVPVLVVAKCGSKTFKWFADQNVSNQEIVDVLRRLNKDAVAIALTYRCFDPIYWELLVEYETYVA